ncbi:sensor histidine kinase [Actinocrinis sp.]|uniref:sensor histidine kinase n=1 Tax=Actinocrinis sp. TaxID=1920516 RepID=UPI002C3A71F2|nr:sensor histidine kinase [Actinocrinis sp.]HXR73663.1 sensor histidine kinase [Actinocrinis sp.]
MEVRQVAGADERRERWAHSWRRFAAAPRIPAVAATLLSLAAVLELAVRTTATETTRVGASPDTSTRVLHLGDTGLSWQALTLVYVFGLAATLSPALSRQTVAAVSVCAANVLMFGLFQTLTLAGAVMQVLVLYRLGRSGSRVLAPALAVPFLALALAGFRSAASEAVVLTTLLASLAPAAALAGLAQRERGEARARSAAEEAIASTLMEHTARGERARIARELHDVVAHHISMIAVQAETARLATPGMPTAGARRLLEIGDTARAALTEMRRLLGVLRDDARAADLSNTAGQLPRAERRPQPTLQQLVELLDEARNASMTGVRLIVSGSPATLDPGVELAAYRIIQEALTNARRHAPGAAVDVELHYTDETLRLRVRDNGPAEEKPGAGHGLLGMRERAAAVGGLLTAGPASVGGFLVEATLPAKVEVIV